MVADTNVLVRVITDDDPKQSKAAREALAAAEKVALAMPALCEMVWVLSQGYKIPSAKVAEAVRGLMNGANVLMNRPAAEAGLAMLEAGGDFADGVIAYEGNWLGGACFLSFDRKAVKLLAARGEAVHLLT